MVVEKKTTTKYILMGYYHTHMVRSIIYTIIPEISVGGSGGEPTRVGVYIHYIVKRASTNYNSYNITPTTIIGPDL